MEEENNEHLRDYQNSNRLAYLPHPITAISQPLSPVEPDVHAAALRSETRSHLISPVFSPHECRRLLNRVFEKNGSTSNFCHIQNLNVIQKEFQKLRKGTTFLSGRLNDVPGCSTEVNPNKSLLEPIQDESQKGSGSQMHNSQSPYAGNISCEEQKSYFCNVRTENFRDGQAVFTQFFVGDVEVDFLMKKNLGWCSGRKSIYFWVKIITSPLLVIWQRQFIVSASNGEEEDITEIFLRHFSQSKKMFDWSIMYCSNGNPGRKVPMLAIAAAVAGALKYGAHSMSNVFCSPCEQTLRTVQEIILQKESFSSSQR